MKRLLRSVSVVGLAFLMFLGGSQVSNAATSSTHLGCYDGRKVTATSTGWYYGYAQVVGYGLIDYYNTSTDRAGVTVKSNKTFALGNALGQDYSSAKKGTAAVYCN